MFKKITNMMWKEKTVCNRGGIQNEIETYDSRSACDFSSYLSWNPWNANIREISRRYVLQDGTAAISKTEARKMQKKDENYIVRYREYEKDASTLSRFYYEEDGEKISIILIGKSPLFELSNTFLEPELNCFSVNGYTDPDLTAYWGEQVFFVNNWHLVKPVKRDYRSGLSTDAPRPDERVFYPTDRLDEYDLQMQDYIPVDNYGDIFMTTIEMNYYAEQEGYYWLMPYSAEDGIEWYHVQVDSSQLKVERQERVLLEGNLPEYVLHEKILENSLEDYNNYFLLKEEMKANEAGLRIIEIYK